MAVRTKLVTVVAVAVIAALAVTLARPVVVTLYNRVAVIVAELLRAAALHLHVGALHLHADAHRQFATPRQCGAVSCA